MRKSTIYLLFLLASCLLGVCMVLHARYSQVAAEAGLQAQAQMVKELRLTDLCLFTEARYTRHPSMADLHAPFQDYPGALEHFPSGSLISPPAVTLRSYAQSP